MQYHIMNNTYKIFPNFGNSIHKAIKSIDHFFAKSIVEVRSKNTEELFRKLIFFKNSCFNNKKTDPDFQFFNDTEIINLVKNGKIEYFHLIPDNQKLEIFNSFDENN